jgi:hypothetical protein
MPGWVAKGVSASLPLAIILIFPLNCSGVKIPDWPLIAPLKYFKTSLLRAVQLVWLLRTFKPHFHIIIAEGREKSHDCSGIGCKMFA